MLRQTRKRYCGLCVVPLFSILVACGNNSTTIQSGIVGLLTSSNRHTHTQVTTNYGVHPKPVPVAYMNDDCAKEY